MYGNAWFDGYSVIFDGACICGDKPSPKKTRANHKTCNNFSTSLLIYVYATNQLGQSVLTTPVVNTAQKAADLSQSIGTTISTPATVIIDPSVISTGTVVDETKAATSTVSSTISTTSPATNNLLASISPNQDPKIMAQQLSQ
ncbi:MAG: hypothetical protein LBI13_00825 [Streptococcaceae bacterium]|jgi:hypothetical protein|nr:hypothetical protein [Streptococcaceae bacterium]